MLQYSHTAHQRIPASEQTQPVQMLSQLLMMKLVVYMELRAADLESVLSISLAGER